MATLERGLQMALLRLNERLEEHGREGEKGMELYSRVYFEVGISKIIVPR